MGDFSCEHLGSFVEYDTEVFLHTTIKQLNYFREKYLKLKQSGGDPEELKRVWWQLIQLLPSSYNQRATVDLNYAVLRNMYHSRRGHKQDEWRITFCDWVKNLPYSELITSDF